MAQTFWKPRDNNALQTQQIGRITLEPLGGIQDVANRLLSIPTMRPEIPKCVEGEYMTLLWERRNVLLQFKEEPEFGSNKVFSLKIQKIEFEKEFHRLYVQMFERFGCVLLYKEAFIAPKSFKKLIE